jgi:hypothetical protein
MANETSHECGFRVLTAISRADLERLFDNQVEKIFRLIDDQLGSLHQKMPEEVVTHLILSGGLGQSPYVQHRLKDRYGEGSYIYPNAQTMEVKVAPDPQLAVCKGLVADRLRKLKAGESVIGWRCCRASYGLLCKELYDKNNPNHVWRKTEKDPRDGKLYVPECIDWFVEKVGRILSASIDCATDVVTRVQGTPVSIDKPKSHDFRRKVNPQDPRRVFPTKVVVSYLDKGSLPYHMAAGELYHIAEKARD